MVTCPRCNNKNPKGQLVCRRCGLALDDYQDQISTQKLQQIPSGLRDQVEWGTETFRAENKLALYVPSVSKTVILIPSGRTVLGRRDRNTSVCPDLDLAPFDAFRKGVSRQHAAIQRESDQTLSLVDLGSVNHTYLNGEQLPPHSPCALHDGDKIRLGDLLIEVYFK